MKLSFHAQLRLLAVVATLPLMAIGALILADQGYENFVAHGPMQLGHENLGCKECHQDAPGTTRQQIQARVQVLLGRRESDVAFAKLPVSSDQCLACHDRPNERHPIYRFNEPRFVEALSRIEANSCLGCHSEHSQERVFSGAEFCVACHQDLKLENDPLDVSHQQLIKDGAWDTCMGCHDFHGNHSHKAQLRLDERFSSEVINDYLKQGASPFGAPKIYEAQEP